MSCMEYWDGCLIIDYLPSCSGNDQKTFLKSVMVARRIDNSIRKECSWKLTWWVNNLALASATEPKAFKDPMNFQPKTCRLSHARTHQDLSSKRLDSLHDFLLCLEWNVLWKRSRMRSLTNTTCSPGIIAISPTAEKETCNDNDNTQLQKTTISR